MLSISNEIENGDSNGIWKKEMFESILMADSNTAILRPKLDSDPWSEMVNDFGELPEDYENIKDEWTEELESSFQSVASSTKDQFKIFENDTGKTITLAKNEVINKFKEDRMNNQITFILQHEED